jgi:UDP-glucose 4-epimerase
MWNTNFFLNVTQIKNLLYNTSEHLVNKYVSIPRSFLVTNICNQVKILCSPCIILNSINIVMGEAAVVYYEVKGKKVKCPLVEALRLCTGRTAHTGSRGIALVFHDQRQ